MALSFQDKGSPALQRVFFAAFLVLALILMSLYAREGDKGVLHGIQAGVSGVFSPVRAAGGVIGAAMEEASGSIEDIQADDDTLSALRETNESLIQSLAETEEYRLEAQRLQELLDLKDAYAIDGIGARIIGRSTDSWNQTVTIDTGSDDGVEVGLTVVGSSGVIGQVISVASGNATVRLLSDPQSGAAAMVQSSRTEGIVRGSLSGFLYLENTESDAEFSVGDIVLTSGLGGSYTKGLLIGTIVSIEGNATEGTLSVVVAPNEEASSYEEVIVVKSAQDSSANSASSSQTGSISQGNLSSKASSSSKSNDYDDDDEEDDDDYDDDEDE